jgi:dienelactone hydrolase
MSCCPKDSELPTHSDHVEKGKLDKVDDLELYVSGSGESAIIVVYDIFGFDGGRVRQVCDQIADTGFLVVLPDFFRGPGWDPANFPPPDFQELMQWIKKVGSWDNVIKADFFQRVIPYLHSKGVKKIGALGFCFGAKMVIHACSHPELSAGAGIHPSFLTPEDAEKATTPMLLLPAGNDPPIEPIKAVFDKKPFAKDCVFKTYPEMKHGWSVRGELSDPAIARDAADAISLTIDFFKKVL